MKTTKEIGIERATKIVESIKADIARQEKILAGGGFVDADGNFQEAGEYNKKQVIQLRDQLAKREAILAELAK